jgi:CyaY protein
MDDHEFQRLADAALTDLNIALIAAADEHGFEADFNAGALTVEFDDPPARFVVSPNSPVKQIWVSANVKSYKLEFDAARGIFALSATGQSLRELMGAAITAHLGQEVAL